MAADHSLTVTLAGFEPFVIVFEDSGHSLVITKASGYARVIRGEFLELSMKRLGTERHSTAVAVDIETPGNPDLGPHLSDRLAKDLLSAGFDALSTWKLSRMD